MLKRLSIVALLVAAVVVILGAYTRLADAGLGCPDWPTCYGHIWVPNSAEEISAANEQFADTPVETDKTWPEQIHRIFASSLGLIILIMFGLALTQLRQKTESKAWRSVLAILVALVIGTVARIFLGDGMDWVLLAIVFVYFANLVRLYKLPSVGVPFKLMAVLAGLVILQGLFGMWTVTLKLWPQVVTSHLLGGFATLSLIWLAVQRLNNHHWQITSSKISQLESLKPLAVFALVVVVIQVSLGGWTSSNYAALACPDFPLCQNSLWPQANFAEGFNILQTIGPNYLGGIMTSDARIGIHLIHRLGAIVVLFTLLALIARLWMVSTAQSKQFSLILAALLVLQVTLGVLNIVLSLPLAIAVAHNAGGAMLLLGLVTLNHRLYTLKEQ